ncbi:hypothetical protein CISG_00029 [Coccidioides immitis RMSCC 3703]|uniref:Uncharacterized protein n=1 Tax=Coccidioides immitis RMSCC 3703 TaxID=454286 RepID=A0A0J8QH99_COCIT|nr:hypothetical protein CISG_00029 [Coccidioides immitis RMSCC 3703]
MAAREDSRCASEIQPEDGTRGLTCIWRQCDEKPADSRTTSHKSVSSCLDDTTASTKSLMQGQATPPKGKPSHRQAAREPTWNHGLIFLLYPRLWVRPTPDKQETRRVTQEQSSQTNTSLRRGQTLRELLAPPNNPHATSGYLSISSNHSHMASPFLTGRETGYHERLVHQRKRRSLPLAMILNFRCFGTPYDPRRRG